MQGADTSRPPAGEWHWLWDTYVVGLCAAAIVAMTLLNHGFPGNVPVAAAALAAIAIITPTVGRRIIRSRRSGRTAAVFAATVVALWVIAVWSSPVAIAAIPAMYPVLFASLPLGAALCVTALVTLTPLAITVLTDGPRSPYLAIAIACTLVGLVAAPVIGTMIMTSMRQRVRLATLIDDLRASRAESARLSHEAGVAAERERLAREIHDTLAQGFTSIAALTQAVEAELDSDPTAARAHIALIGNTARENLSEARGMVTQLIPPALDRGTVCAAIQRLCERLSAETGIAATTAISRPLPELGMATDVVLLRATQEALTNVAKHSHASSVHVRLAPTAQSVRLSLVDNGIGFTDDSMEGFGLRGMRARIAQVGGTISVSPTPGGGATVTIEVPT
ncbi:signal transduction histidine kinase [Mycobacteroides abscessus subsp. bolletii]|uniref:sensor histidine kinase n=1 Tax=Mycobacteroides abscessus TaxID=36809 RepID=UPI0009A66150|nr:sensor histidine kinase [Mycobacteroides abscessus]MDO3125898.1 sensor histidine kinase [Mycobacteroides abscessus subsp. bolletii]SKF99830.1 signal transduction histidine kinase [Mycobacteroides abscessus subsp. bolletii]SKG35487.1 signal transduction histidine kinase [Mycobacteroides abscessus subsp. bolletii]SPX72923.1 signal transduction histidine kinase [Mycobacteroides abscessus]